VGQVTFKVSGDAYRIIKEEAVDTETSPLFLFQGARHAIRNAADLGNDFWSVDCTQKESRDIEDWFTTRATATIEADQRGSGAALRILQLRNAAEAVKRGRRQSVRESL
jgi:hypothetical protein